MTQRRERRSGAHRVVAGGAACSDLVRISVLEPWTAPQPALAAARDAGDARTLAPGEALDTAMTAVLYAGVMSVQHLDATGAVTAGQDRTTTWEPST